MGEVYLADDTRLKRVVALKRLAPRLQSDPLSRRHFLKEAERASQLSHHHIAGLYDVLEEQGETFLVMEYVEGATLRHAMTSPLGVERACDVARQVAEALSEAHRKGIVHFDMKPENIMLTPRGEVKVLDFGLARRLRLVDDRAPTLSMDSFESGGEGGTPGYAAPEVLLRRRADGRADIFSLGVVLYEMLARRHPFPGPTTAAVNDGILHGNPTPLAQLEPAVPADLERTVSQMLSKDPLERQATADVVVAQLGGAVSRPTVAPVAPGRRAAKALAIAAAVLVLTVAVPSVRRAGGRWLALAGFVSTPSLAVIPYTAADGDPETEAYAAGLSEALTLSLTRLTRAHDLQVAPMRDVRSRKVTTPDLARRELGATLVVAGSVRRAADLTRLNLSLTDSRRQQVLQTRTIVAAGSAPFDLEARQIQAVASMLGLDLAKGEPEQNHGDDERVAAAHDLYLQGLGLLQDYDRKENVDRAIALFQKALGLDPSYALVHAGLGQAYRQKYRQTKDGGWIEQAAASCRDAVRLDARLALAHVCLGEVLAAGGSYEDAVASFQRAVDLDPTSDAAFRGLASAYETLGRAAEAEATYRKAIELRPLYWGGYSWLGAFYINQARYADAQRMFERVVTLVPDNHRGYSNLGASYLHQGRYQDAVAVFERANGISPSFQACSNLGTAYYYMRRFPEMVRTYRQATALAEKNYSVWGNLGEALYWDPAGKKEAPAALHRAVDLISADLEINPRQGQRFAERAKFEALLGDRARAREDLDRALALGSPDAWTSYVLAVVENQLGRTGEALHWIDRALVAGFTKAFIRDDPAFDNLRREPRFKEMLRRQSLNES
jgi:tetratricopeptide (TPR) repeat protein